MEKDGATHGILGKTTKSAKIMSTNMAAGQKRQRVELHEKGI